MTTVLDDHSAQPRTHVFIVGVGYYDHMPGGRGALFAGVTVAQLSAPPICAVAVARWFQNAYQNPAAPLGSVEILVSADPAVTYDPGTGAAAVDSATLAHVKQAFGQWYGRCDLNTANVAVFYFCGHGVRKVTRALLLEDFGAFVGRIFENSINLDETISGMDACAARTQCFFIDACQDIPYAAMRLLNDLESCTLFAPTGAISGDRNMVDLHSSVPGAAAYALPDTLSPFTDALLRCLDGSGAWPRRGSWVVTTSSLASAVSRLMLYLNRDGATPSQLTHASMQGDPNTPIHPLIKSPQVPVFFELDPSAATLAASIVLNQPDDPPTPVPDTLKNPPGPWEIIVPAGQYKARVSFQSPATFKDCDHRFTAMPPFGEEQILVQP
jgi:hypothetical protein